MSAIIEVLLYSLGLSLVLAIVYRLLINPVEGKKVKNEMSFYKEKISKARKSGNMEEVNKLTKESLGMSQKQLALTMKPMMFSMILFFVFVAIVGAQYADMSIATPFHVPLLGWDFPFVHLNNTIGWFWWYIFVTVPGSMLFRKLLGVFPY